MDQDDKYLEFLQEISRDVLSNLDVTEILNSSIEKVVSRLNLLGGILFLVEGDRIFAKTIAGGKEARDFKKLLNVPINKLSIGLNQWRKNMVVQTVKEQKVYISDNLYEFTRGVLTRPVTFAAQKLTGTKSSIALPLVVKGECIGALFFAKRKSDDFGDDLPILRLVSDQIAIAISNAQLYESLTTKASQLKETNLKLETSLTEIKELRRKERDMISILAHEIKTPLTVILGSLELVRNKFKKQGGAEPLIERLIENALYATRKEKEQVEKLLSVTKVDGGGLTFMSEEVDVVELVHITLDYFAPLAKKKNLQLHSSFSANKIIIITDMGKLQEILENIVSNAIKYTHQGSVTVSVTLSENMVEFEIKDTGRGMTKEEMDNLGKKFYRARHNDDEIMDPGGTGLGMYVVKSYLKAMGSTLDLQSTKGVGSTFRFRLPAKEDFRLL